MKQPLLVLFLVLTAWKIVRTDWVVVYPWYTELRGHHNVYYRPQPSPAWSPPRPAVRYDEKDESSVHELKSWDDVFGRSKNSFPVGKARLSPDWIVIVFKIGFPMFLVLVFRALRLLFDSRDGKAGLIRACIEESKKQYEK